MINELRGKAKKGIKALFKIDGEVVKDKRVISNGFNMFFSSIASKLNAKLCSSKPVGDGSNSQNSANYKKYFNKRVPKKKIVYSYQIVYSYHLVTAMKS